MIDLFEACANGFFADEYEDILINDNVSVSCLVKSRKANSVIPSMSLLESQVSLFSCGNLSSVGDNFVLTACAKTLRRAKEILKEDLQLIEFDGMKYRSDIVS